ncbi:MAG: hypothetical protein IRY87_20640 [Acetobacteraceae bacterium]|nr:hypothetical protein [Acetobacteraceae bacterium]
MATRGLPAWPWSDAEVDDLPAAERLLLDGMRLWAAAADADQPPLPALRPPFAAEDASAAIAPLDALLRGIAAAGPLALCCPLCPHVAEEEALLLLSCALTQRGARREALSLFLRWLPPGSAYAAMPPAIHLGIALREAGLLLRNPLRMR